VRSAAQDIRDRLDAHLEAFKSAEEVLDADHEYIANFMGLDAVLQPAYEQLVQMGFRGDPPAGGGWIYMHGWRPLTRKSVLQLTDMLDAVARTNDCIFELLDVALNSAAAGRRLVILGTCDGETFLNV
jgi:hypothetical protein